MADKKGALSCSVCRKNKKLAEAVHNKSEKNPYIPSFIVEEED